MPEYERPDGTYEVGYKKPPEGNRFKKGKSGNMKGRPAGIKSNNLFDILNKMLNEKISIKENGIPKKITKREAIMLQLINSAASGDKRSLTLLLKYMSGIDVQKVKVAENDPYKKEREMAEERKKIFNSPPREDLAKMSAKELSDMIFAKIKASKGE